MQEAQTLPFPPYVRALIAEDKTLERLALTVYARSSSPDTVEAYVGDVVRFARWAGSTPQDLIASRGKEGWSRLLDDYKVEAATRGGLSRSTVMKVLSCVKRWLVANGVAKKSDFVDIEPLRQIKVSEDKLPTKEELRKILLASNIEDRVLALVGLSSGIRLNAIMGLTMDQVHGIEIRETGEVARVRRGRKVRKVETVRTREAPYITVEPLQSKNRLGYLTFITPECADMLQIYLEDRQERGEQLTPKSPLLVSLHRRAATSKRSAARRWRNMLKRAGMVERSEGGRTHQYLLHFHVLRKYFKSWTAMSGVPESSVEFFMGHRGGIGQTYFLPNVSRLPDHVVQTLETQYRAAVPALTILNETETVRKLEAQVEEQAKKLEEDRKRFEAEKLAWTEQFLALAKTVEGLKEKAVKPETPGSAAPKEAVSTEDPPSN